MPRLSSPDPQIDQLLATSDLLLVALQAYLDEHKFVTRKILPGVWQKFLASPKGIYWQEAKGKKADILEGVPPIIDVLCEQCGRMFPTNTNAIRCRLCLGADKRTVPPPLPAPPQDELFDLLARGLQDRLKPGTHALDEDRVQALIYKALADEHSKHRYTIMTRSVDDKQMHVIPSDLTMPRWFPRVYKQALCRVHTLLVGPRGCGKTVTGELLAQALGLPLYTISLSAGVSEGVLMGWLHPSKAGLLFEYNRSRFVKAYQEGGVVLLDELDGADPNMLMVMNAALANGKWEIPLRGEDAEPLIKHPDFVCLAAANTHGHGADRVYVGRNQLDGATLDRFAMGRLSVDYDEALEHQAFEKDTVTFGQRLRARCRAQKGWTRDVSTRNIADAHKLQQEFSLEEAWYNFFEDWSDGECEKVGAVRKRDSMSVTLE